MTEWRKRCLGEITSFMSKGIPPKYVERENENTVRVLNQKCNRNFEINYEESRLHDCSKKKVPDDKMLRPGDVLINSTGTGTAGRVAQLYDVPTSTTIDGHMILLRPTEEIDSIYYGYAVKAFQSQIETLAEGSTGQTEINRKRLQEEIVISFPKEKETQDRIAHFLLNIDEKIKVNNKINKNLLEQALTLYATHFSSVDKNGCIGDYCAVKSGFAFKSSWWTNNGVKVIKIGSINQDNLNLLECSYVDEDKADKAKDFVVKAGDLLIAMTGATIGKFSMVPYSSEVLLVNQRVGKFFLGNHPVKKLPFIYCTLKQPEVYNEVVNRGQGSAQPNISASDIMSIPCVIPSQDVINDFNDAAQPLFDLIISNQRENQQLSELRNTLLPKLMSGELDVSDIEF